MGGKKERKPGQIIERGPNRFLLRIYVGRGKDRKRKYASHTVHGTKTQAQKELTRLLHDRNNNRLVAPYRKTLNEFLDEWLELKANGKTRQRTREDYAAILTRYVRPALGHQRLQKVTHDDVQRLYNSMNAAGLAPRTVRYCHAVLRMALQWGVKRHWIGTNPCVDAELPEQKANKEMQAMSEAEAGRFMVAAESDEWYALFVLLLTTGMRPSEAAGLKWDDLDLAGARLTIRRTLKYRNGEWQFDKPKTDKSARTIDLPAGTVQILANLPRTGELVFTAADGKPAHMANIARANFQQVVKRAGIVKPLRMYDLRHTHATLQLLAGVHVKIVSERLGHSTVTITLDTYSHVLPGMGKVAADTMDAMLFKAPVERPAVGPN